MDKNLFRYYQAKNGDTVKSISEFLDISPIALRGRVNGKTGFPLRDVVLLRKRWNLTSDQCVDIFLKE